MIDWVFDGLLALGLLWLGWRVIATSGLFSAVIFFIVFGLLMALCWARLRAPDVALAEAAIGAGLIGALLLDAYRVFRSQDSDPPPAGLPIAPALLCAVLTLAIGWVMATAPAPLIDLAELAHRSLAETGVSNPVTAVLLNYRGYDTLLEVAVLLMALIGVWSVGIDRADARYSHQASAHDSILLDSLVRLVLPLAVLTAGYLLWTGAHAPGGAFQAGAVLAAAGVLLRLTEGLRPDPSPSLWVRAAAVLGCLAFTLVALAVMPLHGSLLAYPPGWAKPLILLIETALTVSIGLTLTLLFVGTPNLKTPSS
jgi:multisubunit Na+/H+ antiporter MnhB subunit